jgi:hypothetical protein
MTTCGVEPRHSHPIPLLDRHHAGSDGGYLPDALMAGDERKCRFERPITTRGVKIRMAHTTSLCLEDDLTGSRRRDRHVFEDEWLSKVFDDGCMHGA